MSSDPRACAWIGSLNSAPPRFVVAHADQHADETISMYWSTTLLRDRGALHARRAAAGTAMPEREQHVRQDEQTSTACQKGWPSAARIRLICGPPGMDHQRLELRRGELAAEGRRHHARELLVALGRVRVGLQDPAPDPVRVDAGRPSRRTTDPIGAALPANAWQPRQPFSVMSASGSGGRRHRRAGARGRLRAAPPGALRGCRPP